MVASNKGKTLQALTVQISEDTAQDFVRHCQRQGIEVNRAVSFLMELFNEADGDFEFLEDAVDGLYAQLALAEAKEKGTIPWEQVKAELGLD
jgi:peroxiredoxin